MGATETRYHVQIDVDDKAGVLAAVAQAFAEHDVSIQAVRQEGRGDDAQLVVVSHRATDADLSGWNWAPHLRPERTTALQGAPCSVAAIVRGPTGAAYEWTK